LKIQLDCVPCYVNQAVEATGYVEMTEEARWEVVQKVCEELSRIDNTKPSAQIGQKVHKIIRDFSGSPDPYREQKEQSNEKAKEFYDEFKSAVENSSDPLNRAARLAAAGNIVDFGPRSKFDIESELRKGLKEGFEINHWNLFMDKLDTSRRILYFSDNSGEIIYDTLFIEELLDYPGIEELALVVKDGPFLNDVTVEDAKDLKIDSIKKVTLKTVDNGDGGESPSLWSDAVKNWMDEYDLVISKGQANYEGLSEYDNSNLFFLLVVKCPIVEEVVGAGVGEKVLINAYVRQHG